MAIRFYSDEIQFQLKNPEKVVQWVSEVITRRGKQVGSLAYRFCSDDQILQVNQQFLNHDTYTDIITFDYVHANLISGDILISVDRVKENAQRFGVEFYDELRRVIIHGVLHLLGQGDKTDSEAAEMRRQEAAALSLWNDMFLVKHQC